MKKNYSIKALLFLGFIAFTFQQTYAQIRIVEVDPSTNTVKLHNYGSAMDPQNISGYWFCSRFGYEQVSSSTVVSGSTNLAVGAEVVLTMTTIDFLDASADVGFYNSPSFGLSTAMEDFMQYGGGGIGREGVAVTKGIWTAGTFVTAAPAYEYTGSGAQNGFQFWDELLGTNDFNNSLDINLYPNPSNSILNIELKNSGDIITFQVFDILGKLVKNESTSSEVLTTIDVSNLNDGLYLIKISTGDKTEIKRFLKN